MSANIGRYFAAQIKRDAGIPPITRCPLCEPMPSYPGLVLNLVCQPCAEREAEARS